VADTPSISAAQDPFDRNTLWASLRRASRRCGPLVEAPCPLPDASLCRHLRQYVRICQPWPLSATRLFASRQAGIPAVQFSNQRSCSNLCATGVLSTADVLTPESPTFRIGEVSTPTDASTGESMVEKPAGRRYPGPKLTLNIGNQPRSTVPRARPLCALRTGPIVRSRMKTTGRSGNSTNAPRTGRRKHLGG